MKRLFGIVIWLGIALLGAGAFAKIAFDRGEPLNATWFVVAAVCCYLVAYRLYSAFVAAKVLALDDTRATPSERQDRKSTRLNSSHLVISYAVFCLKKK